MTTAPVDTEGIETVTVTGDEGEFMGKRGSPPQERHVDLVDLFLSLSFVRERRDSFDSFFFFSN